jgi:hypothetical protein
VGPEALAWGVGVGGSVAVAHASLRNDKSSHKNDDETSADDVHHALLGGRNVDASPLPSPDLMAEACEAGLGERITPDKKGLVPTLFFAPEQVEKGSPRDSDKGE